MRIVEPLLGTRAEVHVAAESADRAEELEGRVLDEVARLEAVFTVFDPESALNRFRRSGATDVAELAQVLALADRWKARSAGAFDPGVESLMSIWRQAEVDETVPRPEVLESAVAALQDRPVDNLNAIAKGWIAQAAISVADTGDPSTGSAWLSLGGDVVHRGEGSVRVGIEDPHRPYDNVAPLATIDIANEALATSGGARRWWTIGERRYPQVLDPRSGQPVDRVAGATVVAADAATADVLATIALVATVGETLALAHEAEACCFLVLSDGSRTCTSGRFEVR